MNIGIIGGGASGMMAAITAARRGHKVSIIEHNARIGKKILSTGNGRCNYTNIDMSIKHFHGGDKAFIDSIIKAFDQKQTVEFFNDLGVFPKEKNGCIYPYSEQASAVLDCLRHEIIRLKIDVITECHPDKVDKTKDSHGAEVFRVNTNKGIFYFDKIIIACGSKANEKTGSDGSGYTIAKSLNHSIKKPLPALCALRCEESFFKSIAGIRCSGNVKLLIDGEMKKEDTGEIQLTDYGISGIPVFQVSYLASRAINRDKHVQAIIDFMPDIESIDELYDLIIDRIRNNPAKCMDELLIGLFHKNLCILFNKIANIPGKANCGEVNGNEINKLCKIIKNFKVNVVSTNSFENAQVCSGGVRCDELKNTLESNIVNNLYFAGEIIDVNGDCGGYNLQFAWSSGYVAGCLK